MAVVDLNADLGEGFGAWRMGDDAALLAIVTSANVACGFHAGDPSTMRRTVRAAAERGVSIGAHVSYPDLVGFGRRELAMSPDDIESAVLCQIGALEACCRAESTTVRYVKAHGALYHRLATDDEAATAFIRACRAFDPALAILGEPHPRAAIGDAAPSVRIVGEGFADRAYLEDGRLVPRTEPRAVLDGIDDIAAQAVRLATSGMASICVHGDSPHAVQAARAVRKALAERFTVAAFA